MSAGLLYISYDGMLEPLGQSQVIAYLERLAGDFPITLISFEKAEDWADEARRSAIRERLSKAGIDWRPLRYHKAPSAPATAYDIAAGAVLATYLVRRKGIRLIHARSYVAAAMAVAAKRLTGADFLFDIRGFWADERVDGGLWPRDGKLFRAAKALEKNFFRAADQIVTLTRASKAEIERFDYLSGRVPPIAVIPTCANLDRFTIQRPPVRDPFVLGYVGSVGTWYLLDEMLEVFKCVQRRDKSARMLIVNRGGHDMIRARLAAMGIADSDVELTAASHEEMPGQIARMSAAMALYAPSYSRIATAPTKLGEYLGCGIPCLGNADVGDVADILDGGGVGVTIDGFSAAQLASAADRLMDLAAAPDIQQRCRAVALEHFSLDEGVARYARLYRRFLWPASGDLPTPDRQE